MTYNPSMDFRLTCGHTVGIRPWTSFFEVLRTSPKDEKGQAVCMRCYLEAKEAAK